MCNVAALPNDSSSGTYQVRTVAQLGLQGGRATCLIRKAHRVEQHRLYRRVRAAVAASAWRLGDARAVAAEMYCTTRLNDSVLPAPDSPAPPRDVAIRGRGVCAAVACALVC